MYNDKTREQNIYMIIWKACDIFRGTIPASQYKDYILTMFFLKYISDFHKAKYDEYLKK